VSADDQQTKVHHGGGHNDE